MKKRTIELFPTYHYKDQLVGDYDKAQTEEEIIEITIKECEEKQMSVNSARIICPVCGEIDKSSVEIYNINLRKQNFALSPILPTCKQCASEIEINDPPKGAELIVLNGTCGSGKSTIAEELMKRSSTGYGISTKGLYLAKMTIFQ